MSSTKEKKSGGLRKGSLGVAGIVFFVVAASAPMAGMTGVVPVAAVLGNGAAVPGAYVAVGLILLLFSVGFTGNCPGLASTARAGRPSIRSRRSRRVEGW